jgi:DNA invertase Pin-like site-specific DNA recombinase
MLHLYAVLAEEERLLISQRTRAALVAKNAQGVKLGSPKIAETAKLGAVANRAAAEQFAANVLPIVREIQKTGAASLRDIAAALNARDIATACGGEDLQRRIITRRAPAQE